MNKLPISVSMISGAEAARIGRALASVAGWTSEIVVVLNEEVRDGTEEIALKYGAKIVREPWHGFRDQKKIALRLVTQPWVLCLDTDEEVSPELRDSICRFVSAPGERFVGAFFARKVWFLGRWITHGDWYPDYSLRLIKNGGGKWSGSPEHDKIEPNGPVTKLPGDLYHYTNPTISDFVRKINQFSDYYLQRQLEAGSGWSAPAVIIRSVWRFLRAYIFRLGFLDGYPGLFIAVSNAYATLVKHSRLYNIRVPAGRRLRPVIPPIQRAHEDGIASQKAHSMSGLMNPLRILQLNSSLKGGGTDDHCVKLAFALHQLGQTVWVGGPDGREFSKVIRALGVPFHATPAEGPLKLRFIADAAKFIRRERIQIVHGHHGRDIWPTILAARLSGANPKVILTRHLAKSPGSGFSRRYMLDQCDALIAVSNFVAKVLREGVYEPNSPEPERRARPPVRGDHLKIHVIHGGIDTARFRPMDAESLRRQWGLQPGHHAFAVVGSYDLPRGKGQREFLQAAARIHAQVPNARFLIIGRGNMADILRADIERLGLKGNAWLTPYCLDMPQAMNAIDCLVLPQVGTEAFGLVVLEAFACGKPVIASALDGIPEAFAAASFGQLVAPESVAELAAAMADWAGRARPSAAEVASMHDKVEERYSVLAFGGRMLSLYRQLLGVS